MFSYTLQATTMTSNDLDSACMNPSNAVRLPACLPAFSSKVNIVFPAGGELIYRQIAFKGNQLRFTSTSTDVVLVYSIITSATL